MPRTSFSTAIAFIISPLIAGGAALAQDQFLSNDRDRDAIYRVYDEDNSGFIESDEIFVYFDSTNAELIAAPTNPNTIVAGSCLGVFVGDQAARNILHLRDLTGEGNALGDNESIVFADATNLSLASFAFPTGAAFDSQCRLHVVNAGNTFGPDAIYRLVDLSMPPDGDAQDAGEVTFYVGSEVFGADNGPYSPQEIVFDAAGVGYLRNSSSALHGIFRFEDINSNGQADDLDINAAGDDEFTLFFGAGNPSNITPGPGFALEIDRARPRSFYTLQIASGGVDQLIRAQDLDNDKDAQDADEAAIVWSESASGFSVTDIVSLANGDVLVVESGSGFMHLLHDGVPPDAPDGDFLDAGERTLYLLNKSGTLLDVRQTAALCRPGDVDCDGTVNVLDLLDLIAAWGQTSACTSANVDCTGPVNVLDLLALISNWG